MLEIYESNMYTARNEFSRYVASLNPSLGFFQNFCGYGVGMTEPVERWIRTAGEGCVAVGMEDIGKALIVHSRHEAGHHEMMLNDLDALDGDLKLASPPYPEGVVAYRVLHEAVVYSQTPWRQLAIEYEIERLSVEHGPKLLAKCPIPLSFVQEHVELDVAHTEYNRRMMDRFLKEYPETLYTLVVTGQAAIAAYAMFIEDCDAPR